MLAFHWECIDYNLKKIKGIMQKIMLARLLFTNIFVSTERKKESLEDIVC